MAASMKNNTFDSLQILLRLLNDIEKKKILTKTTCKGYHDLFKPWTFKNEEKDEETKSKEKSEAPLTDEDRLSSVEKAELELVTKLLSKAEKAYKVKEKLAEPKRSKNDIHDATKLFKHNHEEDLDLQTETLKPGKEEYDDEESVKINTARTSSELKSKINNYKTAGSKSSATVVTKSASIENEKTKNAVNNKVKPRTEIRKPQKTFQSHIKAPFQTNSSIPFPKKSTSITKTAPQIRPTSASRYKQVNKSSSNQIVPKSSASQPSTRNKDVSQKRGQVEGQIEKVQSARSGQISKSAEKEDTDHFELHVVKNTEKGDNRTDINYTEQDNGQVSADLLANRLSQLNVPENKPAGKQKFDLLRDGCHLTIPAKLKKYAAHNRKLRQKYEMYKMTKKVDGQHSSMKILAGIESSFTDIEEWVLMNNITDMTNMYTNLRKYLNSLDLQNISDSSSVYEILRSRKALEMILSTFQQVEEQRGQLDTGCLDNADYIGTCHVDVTTPPLHRQSIWLSDSFIKDMWLPSPPAIMQYRSVRQLERYTSLLFQLQYSQFQSYIQEVFAKDILPFLKSLHPKSSEFILILRASFSLLTSDGTFPVIVQDTIQELEESIGGDDS
ncbi:rho GTPase-activating protein gacN-like [Mytilus edulis]|uniref:rho GTPase-activating protein gacN-like n=1 Tax=Mytilus edulis TaxID=6550 RepID=UPI0039EFCF43